MSARPFHHQRPLAAAAAAYGAGVWTGVRFAWHPIGACVGLALSLLAMRLLPRVGKKRVAGAMGACLFLGMLLSGLSFHPALPSEGKYAIEGTVSVDAALGEDGKARAYLEAVTLTAEGKTCALSKVYWTYYADNDAPFLPREGDRVAFQGNLYHPDGPVNPYGFDSRMYFLQRGAVAGVSGCRDGQATGHPGRGLRSITYRIRQALTARVRLIFGDGSALPEALLLGSREEIPEETARSFSDAGVAHLLAVSGLHVSLLAFVLLLPLCSLMRPRARLTVLGVFLLGYCALLDFSAPVVRASLLMLFAEGRRLLRRAPDGLTALAAAFLLILLFRPLDLFSPGFQLSFLAVLGIVAALPLVERRWPGKRWLRAVAASEGATVYTAVPTVQVFHRLSLVGPLLNPPACFCFSLLLPIYFVVLLIGCVFLPAGQWLAAGVNMLTGWVTAAVAWIGQRPFASVRLPALPWWCVLAVYVALLLISRYVLLPFRRRAALAAAVLALAFSLWPLAVSRDVRYVQLSVGQADSALILDGDETVVIDAGDWGGDLASYLLATGRRADCLILTHLHSDHCLGARELLEQRVPIGRVLLPVGAEEQAVGDDCLELLAALRENGVPVDHLSAGDALSTGRVRITVLWPEGDAVRPCEDANRFGLALLCDMDGVSLFSSGDLPGAYEMYAARDADLLKVSHHGSKSGTSEEFLRAVSPEGAILTGGGRPNSSLPHADTLNRLERLGIPFWNTGDVGAVTVTVRDGAAYVETFLPGKETP